MNKNLLASLIGVFLACLLLLGLEGLLRVNGDLLVLSPLEKLFSRPEKSHGVISEEIKRKMMAEAIYSWQFPQFSKAEESRARPLSEQQTLYFTTIGKGCKPDRFELSGRNPQTGKLCYRTKFSVDKFCRRVTPLPVQKAKYNLLLFGDSFTLGQGSDDDQTASWLLAQLRPEARVVNLGLQGGGPTDTLYELQELSGVRLQDLEKLPTVAVSIYMDNHVERVDPRELAPHISWLDAQPDYEMENGTLRYRGLFLDTRPQRIHLGKILSQSQLLNFLRIAWPPWVPEGSFAKITKATILSRDWLQKFFPTVDFHLVLFPGASSVYGPRLRRIAEREGLKVLDYSNIDTRFITGDRDFYRPEGHPTPITQQLLADLLHRDLIQPDDGH